MTDALEHISGDRSLRRSCADLLPAEAVEPALRFWRLGLQYARFGTVGVAATTLHVGMFAALIELAWCSPLIANALAFSMALPLSFFGHLHWTFRSVDGGRLASRPAMPMLGMFVVVALLGAGLNTLAVYVVTETLTLPYAYAIPSMVVAVPLVVFLLSKLWAFT